MLAWNCGSIVGMIRCCKVGHIYPIASSLTTGFAVWIMMSTLHIHQLDHFISLSKYISHHHQSHQHTGIYLGSALDTWPLTPVSPVDSTHQSVPELIDSFPLRQQTGWGARRGFQTGRAIPTHCFQVRDKQTNKWSVKWMTNALHTSWWLFASASIPLAVDGNKVIPVSKGL